MYVEKLASQIRNDVTSGLRGYHQNLSMNMGQLQDEIIACRLSIINEYFLKGIAPIKDLLMAINCIDVDCEAIDRCSCGKSSQGQPIRHFQIPQLVTQYGKSAIDYLGSTDRQNKFTIVSSLSEFKTRQYKRRGKDKPYVWIDYSPNSNGMLDCFLFNAPFVKQVSIVAVFKDPRQLNKFSCCINNDDLEGADVNNSFIDQLIKDKLTKEKLYFYRQAVAPRLPNDQQYTTGN